nr:hypothetical protein [Tanacetum cinerariifolium]
MTKSEQNRTKSRKNRKRGEARKSQKQSQSVEQEKLNKMQKEWPESQTQSKAIQVKNKREKDKIETKPDQIKKKGKRESKEKQLEEVQAAKAQSWKFLVCYDDDDDEEGYNSLNDNIIYELPPYSEVTPTKPIDSLSMGDEHLDTTPAMESDEVIKSCVENLVPNPNEVIKSCVENLVPNPSESEGENEFDMPAGFTTFSNVLFDDDYDSDSSDDQSLFDKDV